MTLSSPLLTILIPSKDRYETLIPITKQIVSKIRDDRLELVICDNSQQIAPEKLRLLVDSDQRIVYHRVDGDLSVVENTEIGIKRCSGEYICFIGDDDLVSPSIMPIVDWLKGQDCDCLIYDPARYWWNSVHFANESRFQRRGAFWLPKERSGAVRQHDSASELAAVQARGGVAYMKLPKLYHGIASRRALGRILEAFGRYVPGSSPDMALCVALALTTDRYLSIDYPITVSGASRNSGGGWTAARKHCGRIEDQRHLPRDILSNWNKRFPRIWSEQIIYPQTIHEVMSRLRRETEISYPDLYGSLIVYEPHIISELMPVLREYLAENPGEILPLVSKTLLKFAGRVRMGTRMRTGFGMPYDLHIFPDVDDVMRFMERLAPPAVAADVARAG